MKIAEKSSLIEKKQEIRIPFPSAPIEFVGVKIVEHLNHFFGFGASLWLAKLKTVAVNVEWQR